MTGLIRFLRDSVSEIHDSVKTYTTRTLVVPCQSCEHHVHIRVIDVLSKPDKPMDMKCKHCSHVVCFTARQPRTRLSVEFTAPEPRISKPIICDEPLPLGAQAVQFSTGNGCDVAPTGDIGRLISDALPIDSVPPSSQGSNLKQYIPIRKSSVSFSTKLSVLYGNQDSASNDSLHGGFEDQDSMVGQSRSYRSSISLQQEPSFSHSNLMLGLEECGEKTGALQNLWDSGSWHRADSPAPSIPSRFLSGSPVPSLSSERFSERDSLGKFVELGKSEDGQAIEFSLSRRGSGDSRSSSIDLTSGRVESKAVGRRNSDSDPMLSHDSDIRGSISEKRRGKMPMRSNAFYRAAVSRRHSLKIEQQEQHEAETLSAKRRNSISTDFEVEPSDEEVRQAHKIYTETTQHQNQHLESDIQWARVILRRRKNWEHMRYEHPLRGSSDLQLKLRDSVESAASARSPRLVHQPLPPLTIPTAVPGVSPRIPGFSLQAIPTPVEEEPEGDILVLGFAGSSLGQPAAESSTTISNLSASTSSTEPERPASLEVTVPSLSGTERGRLACLNDATPALAADVGSSTIAKAKSKCIKAYWRKIFRKVTRRASCFHESDLPLRVRQQSIIDITGPVADFGSSPESLPHQRFRSSGEIQDVLTSEAPLIVVANEVAALVAAMNSPLFQIRFQARTEDLFPGMT